MVSFPETHNDPNFFYIATTVKFLARSLANFDGMVNKGADT